MIMSALSKSMDEARAFSNTCREMFVQDLEAKAAIGGIITNSGGITGVGFSSLFGGNEDKAERERYKAYRTWLYSAIHSLAFKASRQPLCVGEIKSATKASRLSRQKMAARLMQRMPPAVQSKAAAEQLEVVLSHPLLTAMEQPNPIQSPQSFVYMFVANLCLTGWGYVIYDEGENGPEFYTLPSSWVIADHSEGPFSRFKVRNPQASVGSENSDEWLDASQVGWAYLPNPADPLGSTPPAETQMPAIRIDDSIQQCQENFFKSGCFPSVAIAVGKEPHPDVPGGIRPRLSQHQRNQINQVIREQMAGVWNYGKPAIIDGLIESITRLVPTQQEIGWEKSEEMIRNRILSAYGVNPFMMGETVNVGGYAQAYVIREVFCDRVNGFLDMLSQVVTRLARANGLGDNLLAWWEETLPQDYQIYQASLEKARERGDITKNEYRSQALNMPPDLDEDAQENRSPLLDMAGGITGAVSILSAMGNGLISRKAAVQLMMSFYQVDQPEAERMVGDLVEPPEPDPQPMPFPPQAPQQQLPPPADDATDEGDPEDDAAAVDQETLVEGARMAAVKLPPATVAEAILKYVESMQAR